MLVLLLCLKVFHYNKYAVVINILCKRKLVFFLNPMERAYEIGNSEVKFFKLVVIKLSKQIYVLEEKYLDSLFWSFQPHLTVSFSG